MLSIELFVEFGIQVMGLLIVSCVKEGKKKEKKRKQHNNETSESQAKRLKCSRQRNVNLSPDSRNAKRKYYRNYLSQRHEAESEEKRASRLDVVSIYGTKA